MITFIDPIRAFTDNYIWLIHDETHAVVVDPGDGNAVLKDLTARGLTLTAILVTHHHPDHIGGIPRLLETRSVPVYGPRAESAKITSLTKLLDEGDRVRLPVLDLEFDVLAVPGHTLGHIAYCCQIPSGRTQAGQLRRVVFCGDTLFICGCGKLFEGTPAQMHHSLEKLAALPEETEVFCAHEYTLSNLAFAQAVEPESAAIAQEIDRIRTLRAENLPSVPGHIGRERHINPFLRCSDPSVARRVETHFGYPIGGSVEVFAALRRWKDEFRAPVV